MATDIDRLLQIARNLSDFGVAVRSRQAPPDAGFYNALGQALVEVSEAIGDMATELGTHR